MTNKILSITVLTLLILNTFGGLGLRAQGLPDLVVTDLWDEGNLIYYQVMNIGETEASGGFTTALFFDDYQVGEYFIDKTLGPGERLEGSFIYESPPDSVLSVFVDYYYAVWESNEENNVREEAWNADSKPPKITLGPLVNEITQISGIIYWETSEESDSLVRYGKTSGSYDLEARSSILTQTHVVPLSELEPSTTYHFIVESGDSHINVVRSRDLTFETLPAPDVVYPTIQIIDPGLCQGSVTISAEAFDDVGIEKVEFYVDGMLLLTDYSWPYECPLDTTEYAIGTHQIQCKVYDLFGNPLSQNLPAEIYNAVDLDAPTVEITYPEDYAYVSDKIKIDAYLTDDTGLSYVILYIDGVMMGAKDFPVGIREANIEFSWDTTVVANGVHRIAVEAHDLDDKLGLDTVDVDVYNAPPPPQPKLVVTFHTATRYQNGFSVELTVMNVGQGLAKNVCVQDFLQSLQPISRSTTIPTYADYSAHYSPANAMWNCYITSHVDMLPGESQTYSYGAVPVLVYPGSPSPVIGNPVKLFYEGTDGTRHSDEAYIPVYQTTDNIPIATAFSNALKEADYVLATNPKRLYQHYDMFDVDMLLSSMAQLAVYEQGVLGFLNVYDKTALDDLIEPNGLWAKKLHPKFSTTLGGYLLIVGETEIMPSWNVTVKNSGFGPYVEYTDLPYADTGGLEAPELIVGRIIGDSAEKLVKPIQASIGVYEGSSDYLFDRDIAVLLSDADRCSGVTDVESVRDIIGGEFLVRIMHWKDYFEATPAFNMPESFPARKGSLVVGDVTGDVFDELIVGDISSNTIMVISPSGTILSSFTCGYTQGDALAVGNLIGTGKEQIVVGDISADKISVYDSVGTLIYEYSRSLNAGDAIAIGNVNGSGKDQLLVADASNNLVYITEITNNSGYITHVDLGNFVAEFDLYDSLALGDLAGDAREEAVISDVSQSKIWIRSMEFNSWTSIEKPLVIGDCVVVGNIFGLQKSQILACTATDRMTAYLWVEKDKKWVDDRTSIPRIIGIFDAVATGDIGKILGTNKDEVVHINLSNRVHIYDTNWVLRVRSALPNYLLDSDVIYYAGHGNINGWGAGIDSYYANMFPLNFDNHSPFVISDGCLTGNYDRGDMEDKNIAESFLDSGAAVYIGSTMVTWGYTSRTATQKFFQEWTASKSIGDVFTKIKRDFYIPSQYFYNWIYWMTEYNLYGDPKFGTSFSNGGIEASALALFELPSSMLQVEVPDYLIYKDYFRQGLDYAEIPGGFLWPEEGEPLVPFYTYTVELPAGTKVQDVSLTERADFLDGTSLNLAMAIRGSDPSITETVPYSGGIEGWFPEQDYDWVALTNPDGTTSLIIVIYPFKYNTLTHDYKFYKNYSFEVAQTTSTVKIKYLTTDKSVYRQGDAVVFDVGLENSGAMNDVVFEAQITKYGNFETEAGLTLQTLKGLNTGSASYTVQWMSDGFEPGYYRIEAALRDSDGNLLDEETATFQLGASLAEVKSLAVEPEYFQPGDYVQIEASFRNGGTIDVTGNAVVRVTDQTGNLVSTFIHDITDLKPSETVAINDVWDTTYATSGSYNIIAFMSYDGGTTEPARVTIHADNDLPVISILAPSAGETLKGVSTLKAKVSDPSGVSWVNFSIRLPGGEQGTVIDVKYESIPATLIGDEWQMPFDTCQLPDGDYLLLVKASDSRGNEGFATVDFNIRNWVIISLLPPAARNNAGRTIPIKFTLRVDAEVNPTQPFVLNKELMIKIYEVGYSEEILQTSYYGTTSLSYRIDAIGQFYITNFKTLKTPANYIAEVYLSETLLGSIQFRTVSP